MIEIEKTEVHGWEAAIRGMRNPKNSWEMSDSHCCDEFLINYCDCAMVEAGHESAYECDDGVRGFCVGEKDMNLMTVLANAGADHGKFMRFITVTVDLTAPLYWWKEFDTYKIGTVANSCSTMHKIHAKEFTLDDFSTEHLNNDSIYLMADILDKLNQYRDRFLNGKDKDDWWQMIQLLPSSYNQKRTVMLNYAVLKNMYHARKNHKLDEWHTFCDWIDSLPYSALITGETVNSHG